MDNAPPAAMTARRRRRRGGRGRRHRPQPAAAVPAHTPAPAPAATPADGASAARALAAEEKAWERTHLEQVMFRLAREHAEAAARAASASPPDREGERTHSLLSVLMAYFAVEAFINMVGQDRLGARFRHYDRMSPEGKWLEVTRLVSKTGRTFDEDGKELSALSKLRSWRNTLTHYKGRYEDTQGAGETQVDALLSAENAKEAVETATMLYRSFYELDRRSPPRQFVWLDDRAPAPVDRRAAGSPATMKSTPARVPGPRPVMPTGTPSSAKNAPVTPQAPHQPAAPSGRRRRRRRGGGARRTPSGSG